MLVMMMLMLMLMLTCLADETFGLVLAEGSLAPQTYNPFRLRIRIWVWVRNGQDEFALVVSGLILILRLWYSKHDLFLGILLLLFLISGFRAS